MQYRINCGLDEPLAPIGPKLAAALRALPSEQRTQIEADVTALRRSGLSMYESFRKTLQLEAITRSVPFNCQQLIFSYFGEINKELRGMM